METKDQKKVEENEKLKSEQTIKADEKKSDKDDDQKDPHEKGSCCGGCGG